MAFYLYGAAADTVLQGGDGQGPASLKTAHYRLFHNVRAYMWRSCPGVELCAWAESYVCVE